MSTSTFVVVVTNLKKGSFTRTVEAANRIAALRIAGRRFPRHIVSIGPSTAYVCPGPKLGSALVAA